MTQEHVKDGIEIFDKRVVKQNRTLSFFEPIIGTISELEGEIYAAIRTTSHKQGILYNIASISTAIQIYDTLVAMELHLFKQFFNDCRNTLSSGGVTKRLYEAAVHRQIPQSSLISGHCLSRGKDMTNVEWFILNVRQEPAELIHLTRDSVLMEEQYYVPHHSDEFAFDSMYITSGRVYLFKMVVTPHDIRKFTSVGLEVLCAVLKGRLPTEEKPWRLVFVVPPTLDTTESWATLLEAEWLEPGDSDGQSWEKLFSRYVVTFDMDNLSRLSSDSGSDVGVYFHS